MDEVSWWVRWKLEGDRDLDLNLSGVQLVDPETTQIDNESKC